MQDNGEGGEADAEPDINEHMLIALWRAYKENNPDGTLDGFYKNVSTSNSEEQ